MEATRALLLLVITIGLFLQGCNAMGYWKDEAQRIHVQGKVLCQDCTQGWKQWAYEGTPIHGSWVAVSCMDQRKRVVYYGSDQTDGEGNFVIPIDKFIHGKELPLHECSVRLVSSPDRQCDIPTDFAEGKSGVKLRRPSHVDPGMIKYSVGPFFFTSPMCEEPDTTTTDSPSEEGNY